MPDPISDIALLSMCMTWRHDFGLLDRKEQMAVRSELLGLYKHHVKPAIDRAKAAEFTAHTFSVACDAHKRRSERAESCLRRVQRLADDGVDDPAGPYNVLAQIANTAEVVLSSPPADASKMGGEREHPYGYCPVCGAPGMLRERRPNGNDYMRECSLLPKQGRRDGAKVMTTQQELHDALVLAERILESYQPKAGLEDGEELHMRQSIRAVVGGELIPYEGEVHRCADCGFEAVMDKFLCDEDRLYCPECRSDDVGVVPQGEGK